MNPLIQLKNPSPLILIALLLACLPLSPGARAVVPAPDGGYPGQNTAEGQSALLHLAGGGTYNTALGWASLAFNVTGDFNTAVGAATLLNNTADENTATGAGAVLNNSTGSNNTANGAYALIDNTVGAGNTATGNAALFFNTAGDGNTANGYDALLNTTGSTNTAVGFRALMNNTTGNNNIAVGFAGGNVTTASNVICIGAIGNNVDNSCYIGQIFSSTVSESAVFVNSNGRLGTMTSSKRIKQNIKPMDNVSEALYSLKPVSFRYKKEFDAAGMSQFGLVAEDVEKINSDLVVRDKDGKAYSVRYDQVNAMLLNEFLKEHNTVQDQGANIAELKKEIAALTAGLQKVSAQLEASKPAPQVVKNP
jgi:hypothetical protein